ncbi:MAG: Uma2 family endonuclease [Anaerolineae bacterium]|nr:Uma2 family endonuclease [Anaerolineae bacterium]
MITLPIPTDVSHSVRGPAQGNWTYADWEKLPDDGNRYEIIAGALYMTTAPSFFHQWIIQRLYRRVGVPAEDAGLAICALAPVGVLLPTGAAVQPDFLIILRQNTGIIHEGRIRGVPDLIVEVISPGSADYDEGVKLEAYARANVPEYAVIDPATRKLRLYAPEAARQAPGTFAVPREFAEGDSLSFACLPDILLNVSDLFANAPDTTV